MQTRAYHKGLTLGGRNFEKVIALPSMFMYIHSTFYGNRFTHALGYPIRMSVEELLKRVEWIRPPTALAAAQGGRTCVEEADGQELNAYLSSLSTQATDFKNLRNAQSFS